MIQRLATLAQGHFSELTSFFSLHYLLFFFPAALAGYILTPGKWKKFMLLALSLGFFFLISGVRILHLLLTVLSVWGFGLWLDKLHREKAAAVKAAEKPERKAIKQAYLVRSRVVLGLAALLHIGSLLVLKYSGFFLENVNALLGLGLPVPSFLLPIGISFYTLQAFSYLFDVYRGTQEADRNILRLALFLSFFPQIVEGPICRYQQTADGLWNVRAITWEDFTLGSQRILYGMMKKLVVADRLNAFIEAVFTGYSQLEGGIIALAALCYTVQLYMDFSGAMDAVCGTAQIFGVTMPENFRRPFFSKTVSEFWTRWHISLGSWFKDYVFYPVSVSKPVKNAMSAVKKRFGAHTASLLAGGIALLCVWSCNGLWHGAAWSYIFFGMYHFVLIFSGSLTAGLSKKVQTTLHIPVKHPLYRGFQILRTCVLVVIGELFFRAEGLRAGLAMFRRMMTDFRFTTLNPELLATMQIDGADFCIVAVTLVIVFTVSLLQERGIAIRQTLAKKPTALRWAVLYALIFYIILFGAYGKGYVPVNPMYANF
ncbi:MAG: MBOAT family protein [Oscillospiraceae bacterium]|nr:MBOAT family protein [Oscillospiraceae bacterium]